MESFFTDIYLQMHDILMSAAYDVILLYLNDLKYFWENFFFKINF